jgi:hypothetical protein
MRQKRDMSHGEVMFERMRLISQYKFVLAFENTEREDDYVTEKVFGIVHWMFYDVAVSPPIHAATHCTLFRCGRRGWQGPCQCIGVPPPSASGFPAMTA